MRNRRNHTKRYLSLKEAKRLRVGDILYHNFYKNKNGSPQRWKVEKEVKTWKNDKEKIEITLKHGQQGINIITEADFDDRVCRLLRRYR